MSKRYQLTLASGAQVEFVGLVTSLQIDRQADGQVTAFRWLNDPDGLLPRLDHARNGQIVAVVEVPDARLRRSPEDATVPVPGAGGYGVEEADAALGKPPEEALTEPLPSYAPLPASHLTEAAPEDPARRDREP